ncbi:type II toxin-antitoxin system Phd/YefM family antitoxin [Candidatus Fermentibacteria bacterium]|nr:type II toxin-antitoxin system Phd/YefM family antitoxin [Candidatus Fermentibacteria bacterium]
MRNVTFTEFRRNASVLLSDVEGGDVLVVIRHGRPIAEVSPVTSALPAWKQPALRLATKGAGLAAAILGERVDENVL